ncbi:MAG: YidC/Oxa1 family insertase periplasmic-domain containing protein [Phycisphaerae bacterium]|nr:YidC/Oxa1 family insertase periplasmic-domain containing protein [Phycisphaerae bacterium]
MKKGQLGFILLLTAGVVLAMHFFNKSDQDKPNDAPTKTAVEAKANPPADAGKPQASKTSPPAPSTLGSLDPKSGYKFQVKLTSTDSAIETVKLADYFATVADKQLFDKAPDDYAKYAKLAAENPEKYKGNYTALAPAKYKGAVHRCLATRVTAVKIGDDDVPNILCRDYWKKIDSKTTDTTQEVTYEWAIRYDIYEKKWRDHYGKKPEDKIFAIRKIYRLTKDSYSIHVSLKVENYSGQTLRFSLSQDGPTGLSQEGFRGDERKIAIGYMEEGQVQPDLKKDAGELAKAKYEDVISIGSSDGTDKPIVWMGFVNKFFGSILYLEPAKKDILNAASYRAEYSIKPIMRTANGEGERTWWTKLDMKNLVIGPAEGEGKPADKTINFDLFVGPKLQDILTAEGSLYAKLDYQSTISSSSCTFCTFDWLMKGLMWLLTLFATELFYGNYGLAIILLVGIVRVCLHPLTKKGQISMAKMQKQMAKLKPQMDKLKEKYANDKATLQSETMKLYKQHGNPMSGMLGCLPMMLQMPIWIALFSGLNTEVALRHAAFLPIWITDLSSPDHLFSFGRDLPWVGGYFNLLPLLLTVAMFLQTKFNPSMSGGGSTSPEQAQQQKMMKYMMPVMMLFFFYKAPSGLCLYIMTSTFAGVAEQFIIRKHLKEQEEIQAASETVVKVSGKGPRDGREKKPKGPKWVKRG